MAKKKEDIYYEPDNYIPEAIQRKLKLGKYAEQEGANKAKDDEELRRVFKGK